MTTATVPEIRVALAIKAYGIEIQLWKEVGQREWGATLRDDTTFFTAILKKTVSRLPSFIY